MLFNGTLSVYGMLPLKARESKKSSNSKGLQGIKKNKLVLTRVNKANVKVLLILYFYSAVCFFICSIVLSNLNITR